MNKIFKLKKWLSIADTAKHLSNLCEEEVAPSDILQLAIDREIKLTVIFSAPPTAKRVNILSESEIESREVPGLDGNPVVLKSGIPIGGGAFLKVDDEPVRIPGEWDLPMLGGERTYVENQYRHLMGIPEADIVSLDGIFVEKDDGLFKLYVGEDGDLFQLQEIFDRKFIDKNNLDQKDRYYPAGALPDDTMLVVRTSEVKRFAEKIQATDKSKGDNTDNPKSQNSLLKMVITMAKKGYSYNPKDKRSETAKEIADDAIDLGLSIDPDTVRKWLKTGAELLDQEPID